MLKKFIIFGLVLLLGGTAAIGWVLAEQRKEKQLLQEKQEKLKVNLDNLNKLVAGITEIPPSAGIVSSENLQQELDEYKTRKEKVELALTVSIMCMLIGGAIFTWCLLLLTARLLIRAVSNLKKFFTDVFRRRREIKAERLAKTHTEEDEKVSEQEQKPHKQPIQNKKRSKVLVDSGWHNFNENHENRHEPAPSQAELLERNESDHNNSAQSAGKIAVLFSDENSAESEESLKVGTECPNLNTRQFNHSAQDIRETASSDSCENSDGSAGCLFPRVVRENCLKLEDSLKAQTENLEEQAAEFGQMTQTVEQTAIAHTEPLNNTLVELTQQVAAIREYACQQQDRVEKLQDGYDWNITRTFCLRIIRCIDNLEDRIEHLSKQDIKARAPQNRVTKRGKERSGVSCNKSQNGNLIIDLEEVRDELIFALESSGVEQFEPEINSDYHGQEKIAEAVKDRESSDDPNLTGKIAKVLRRGYQYVIDEENVKVVRPARVKLFG